MSKKSLSYKITQRVLKNENHPKTVCTCKDSIGIQNFNSGYYTIVCQTCKLVKEKRMSKKLDDAISKLEPKHRDMVSKVKSSTGALAKVNAVLANTELMMNDAVTAFQSGTPFDVAIKPLRDGLAFLKEHAAELLS